MLVATLVIMLVLSAAIEARSSRTADAPAKKDSGVGGQFLQSFTCIFTQCGWPAIIILILPVFGMWVYKKYFSLW
jgi:hypothetical protein